MEEKNSWIQMQKGQEPDMWVVMREGKTQESSQQYKQKDKTRNGAWKWNSSMGWRAGQR